MTARGNNRAAVFRTPEHRDRLTAILARVVDRYGRFCHAYVVMHNHFHVLVETPLPNLSTGMPALMPAPTYSSPSASVQASSRTCVAPASCMW